MSATIPDETGGLTDVELASDITKIMGWYATLTYRFCDWFEGGLTYSEQYDNAEDMDGSQREKPPSADGCGSR